MAPLPGISFGAVRHRAVPKRLRMLATMIRKPIPIIARKARIGLPERTIGATKRPMMASSINARL